MQSDAERSALGGFPATGPGPGGAAPAEGAARPRAAPLPFPRTAHPHDALLALDIETVVDDTLLPANWAPDRFPKGAWHRVVAISFVEAVIERHADGRETYRLRSCRSGGEPGWGEERLLRAFWRYFDRGRYRVVTWNGRSFDMPTLLLRSMAHGIPTVRWHRAGTKWENYNHRHAEDWHTDLMEAMAYGNFGGRLTLDEAAALLSLPGKLGEHGSAVAAMVAAGDIGRVRAYCETDTLNLFGAYVRWAASTGRTDAAGHDEVVGETIAYLEAQRTARPHLGLFLDAWLAAAGDRTPFIDPSRPGADTGGGPAQGPGSA